MSASTKVVIAGGIYIDHLIRGPTLPTAGATLMGLQYLQAPGGKGANQAVAAARQQVGVAMIGCVGDDDTGKRALETLRNHDIDITQVRVLLGQETGTAVVQIDEHGEKQILAVPGATTHLDASQVTTALATCPQARILVLQLEAGLDIARTIIRDGHARGLTVLLDPSPVVPLPDEVLRLVHVIKPDATEAEALTGIRPRDRSSAMAAAQQLRRRGVAAVLVQAGDHGDVLVDGHGDHWLPHHHVETIDATGAGDAMMGVLAARLARGRPLREAAEWGSAAAGLATTALGAQSALPVPAEVIAQLARRNHDDKS